ncbi:mannose-1-phosphate guanyltransferase [Candidatus Francisella endociliophora]|uniref:Mannose-1-phosphate guanyltransferase n=1 Tax=Candidatus Francisella endociliophora TaxID=653937 RepID=A0A097ERU1_9GAMM|nr:ABC transporter permease [Francisella sp. FSC1006]AIT10293.1 mannose-1-phosphate guanyltransferase [Francisella sp. FSC1006]
MKYFSFNRYYAILLKEVIHMMRDKLTIGLVIGIPLIQLILFGFAINMNPKHLSTALVNYDRTIQTNYLVSKLNNTDYFNIKYQNLSQQEAVTLMRQGKVQFIIEIPPEFTKNVYTNKKPNILVIADGASANASAAALDAMNKVKNIYSSYFTKGATKSTNNYPFNFVIHNKYNPENKTQNTIVPGLAGVILTMTMVMVTAMTITREKEYGTMESLLATPVSSLEIIFGKITPYVLVGYIQLLLIIFFAKVIFDVTIIGSIFLLLVATLPFILANLIVGITFSTIAETQLQAMQMTFFFFLPSILLSGFMFPFDGMPEWAQFIGNILPLTHYLNIIREILLKGGGLFDILNSIYPLFIFMFVVSIICLKRYKNTI